MLRLLYAFIYRYVSFHWQAFIKSDIAFSMKPYFRGPFCIDDVRQGLMVNYLKHLVEKCDVRTAIGVDFPLIPQQKF